MIDDDDDDNNNNNNNNHFIELSQVYLAEHRGSNLLGRQEIKSTQIKSTRTSSENETLCF